MARDYDYSKGDSDYDDEEEEVGDSEGEQEEVVRRVSKMKTEEKIKRKKPFNVPEMKKRLEDNVELMQLGRKEPNQNEEKKRIVKLIDVINDEMQDFAKELNIRRTEKNQIGEMTPKNLKRTLSLALWHLYHPKLDKTKMDYSPEERFKIRRGLTVVIYSQEEVERVDFDKEYKGKKGKCCRETEHWEYKFHIKIAKPASTSKSRQRAASSASSRTRTETTKVKGKIKKTNNKKTKNSVLHKDEKKVEKYPDPKPVLQLNLPIDITFKSGKTLQQVILIDAYNRELYSQYTTKKIFMKTSPTALLITLPSTSAPLTVAPLMPAQGVIEEGYCPIRTSVKLPDSNTEVDDKHLSYLHWNSLESQLQISLDVEAITHKMFSIYSLSEKLVDSSDPIQSYFGDLNDFHEIAATLHISQ